MPVVTTLMMAPSSETDDGDGAFSSDPPTDATTTTKRQCLNSSTVSPTSPSTSSSSITPEDSFPLPTLPFELVVDILSRLPIKFLMQLRSVCKSWKSLISDPNFAKKHLRVSNTRHRVLLMFSEPSPEFVITTYPLYSAVSTEVTPTATQLEYPLGNRNRFECIVGSCHGIICIKLYCNFFVLWNPSIRKFTTSPSLKYPPTRLCHIFDFGYDRSTDTYKVIAVFCIRGNGVSELKSQANVYTIGTNYWRSIQADFPPPVPLPHTCSTFVSGTINWFSIDNISTQVIIVSLDLETESYRELLQPDDGVMDVVSPTLHVLMDCLCISYHNHNHNFLDVWLMKEYGNEDSWTKLFRVPNMGDVSSFPYTRALHVYEDDIVLLQGFQLLLGVYNSRDGTFQTLEIQNTDSRMVPQVYQESLISPCS